MEQNNIEGTIEDLTEANLKKHGFEPDEISDFFNPNNFQYEIFRTTTNKGIVFGSAKEGKIYSGLAGARKAYFETGIIQFPYKYPQLISEYHEIKLAAHINSKKRLLGSFYNENSEKRIFIDNQILWANNEIEKNQKAKEKIKYNYELDRGLSNKTNIEILKSYLAFLSRLLTAPPLHNKIEAGNEKSNSISLITFFKTDDNEQFIKALKEKFTNEKGKNIKILIEVLKELDLVSIDSRGFKNFYDSMKSYFDRDIGTYQSINDFKNFKTEAYKPDFKIMIDKVNFILTGINKQ